MITSANAIFITRNKLFLRSFLLTTKRTIVSMFLMTTRTASNAKALRQVIPSALERRSSVDKEDVLFKPVAVDVFFIVLAFER